MSEQNLVDAAQQVFADDFEGGFDSSDSDFEPSADGTPGPGQGQSKSSRRRRRKRKNKVAGDGTSPAESTGSAPAPQQQTIIMEGESLALSAGAAAAPFAAASPAPARSPRPAGNNGDGGQANGPAGTGKRWKKKFRERERRPGGGGGGGRSENPGNDFRSGGGSNNGGGHSGYQGNGGGGGYSGGGRPDNFGNLAGGFKRKGKQGPKERGFVGPMDHSYRVEGAESGPASTIHLGGRRSNGPRHHGDSQPIDHNMPRPVPIPENAQTHIYFFIEELFFIAKIQETARKQGVKVGFVKNDKEAIEALTSGEEENKPALIVFDLNNANAKPMTLIPKLKAKLKRGTSIVGFLSHLQGDLKAKAMEAGCDVVMPRAAFSQNLPNLLRRYGVEEEDEVNYNY